MNETNSILVFHGSPGHHLDFNFLKDRFQNIIFDQRYSENNTHDYNQTILLGYSWGCFHALKHFYQCHEKSLLIPKTIILLSPYLFNPKVGPKSVKALLNTPLIGKKLLQSAAPAKIEKMLIDSSHPKEVPDSYKKESIRYLNPDLLLKSTLEKSNENNFIQSILTIINECGTKLHVIYGPEDLTSKYDDQILPLMEKCQNIKIHNLEGAGHAIPWTHRNELISKLTEII